MNTCNSTHDGFADTCVIWRTSKIQKLKSEAVLRNDGSAQTELSEVRRVVKARASDVSSWTSVSSKHG